MRVLGNTCSKYRRMSDIIANSRFRRLTRMFFNDYHDEFPIELLRCKGVVTGSVALEMYLGHGAEDPRDFNIVVPRGGIMHIENWLISSGFENFEDASVDMREEMAPVLAQFRVYEGYNRKVTVSEANGLDIMEVIVNSPTTAEMIAMTAGGIIVLYPELATSGKILLGPTGGRYYKEKIRCGSVNGPWGRLYTDNRDMPIACGPQCPSIWRHTRHDRNILVFDWDKRYTIRGISQNCQTEWRLHLSCPNPHCTYGSGKLETSPATNMQIADIELNIIEHIPPLAPGFKGLLYATLCDAPVIVNVPCAEGIPCYRNLDELKVDCWVRQRDTHAAHAQRAKLRRTYNFIPSMPTIPADYAYTIFVEEPTTRPQLNAHVNMFSRNRSTAEYILGNILVVKRTNDEAETSATLQKFH
ncbi:hypothetical protein BJ138DRAFT_1116336 [Hygrophoropsis aurantiaca]|uniref:Uncharacterized protein n=1 Tax=Hygrophoropsis aurantiaca TaxID=72124 RepID=A0ACB8A472_9AGAM|nr:hypothetical protein BJ138DRAFT_1116336 [Hygrophoropsis aurantiaca]